MIFYVGLHQPSDMRHFSNAFVSVNRIRNRVSTIPAWNWIMDSGAFTTIMKHGGYPEGVEPYAAQIKRWAKHGNLRAAVAQDYMCEPHMLEKTGLTVADHQHLTIERYDALLNCDVGGVYIMPVLQGYTPQSYVDHLRSYGGRLAYGAYVGVGSICKRNGDPSAIIAVLSAIKRERPDLRLHGFGVKTTSLQYDSIRELLHSADSMAWSFSARRMGDNPNDWRGAKRFEKRILSYGA